ncbi:MAG: 30S ribosomal protein S12 methylthiotransferase RimO [Calditrichaeota bacterium]|nr:MAG: 30S ribosomal protein S12 methylthiotransferase RimO [Calditrichota bacterium]
MKTAFINLGCPKNQVDLETILGGLSVEITPNVENADVVIINTCAFIESAKRESIDAIFDMLQSRKKNEHLKVLVSGCLPQRYQNELITLIPEVDKFFPSTLIQNTIQEIQEFLKIRKNPASDRLLLTPPHYAYLRIADGCDNRCTYCAIPLIKGGYTSRTSEEIVAEAVSLVERGVKELLIIAQDTTFFGHDLNNGMNLSRLLQQLDGVEGLSWIRLLYTHPAHWSDALIDTMASLEKVAPYADIPIQHISDSLLSRMGRKVTRAQIEQLLDNIRRHIPGLALRTSIITGFPGETDQDFLQLIDFIEHVQFDHLGVFTYSREEGTPAFKLKDNIPEEVKLERQREIMRIQGEIVAEKNDRIIGNSIQVLVDEIDFENNRALGHSRWSAPEIDGNILLGGNVLQGEFYQVRITGSEMFDLIGELDN